MRLTLAQVPMAKSKRNYQEDIDLYERTIKFVLENFTVIRERWPEYSNGWDCNLFAKERFDDPRIAYVESESILHDFCWGYYKFDLSMSYARRYWVHHSLLVVLSPSYESFLQKKSLPNITSSVCVYPLIRRKRAIPRQQWQYLHPVGPGSNYARGIIVFHFGKRQRLPRRFSPLLQRVPFLDEKTTITYGEKSLKSFFITTMCWYGDLSYTTVARGW